MKKSNLRSRVSIISLLLLFLSFVVMSYFGSINPVVLGLISGLSICGIFLSIGILLFTRSAWLYIIYLITTFVFFNVIIFTNWWHFQYFGAFFNYESLHFGGSAIDGLKSFDAYEYRDQSKLLLLVSSICIVVHLCLYRKRDIGKKWSLGIAAICVALSVFGLSEVATLTDKLKQRNAFLLSPKYLHPAHAFFTSITSEKGVEDLRASWRTFKNYNTSIAPKLDKSLPFLSMDTDTANPKLNVITIVIESFRASMIGHYGGKYGITPNFDRIAQETISARQFYANSNYTVKGETSIFCGIFDHNIQIPIAEYPQKKNLKCLPYLLGKLGYSSYYFHGNRGKFYNRYDYLPQIGFENLYFHADQDTSEQDGRSYIGWGLSDNDMFEIMLKKLETVEQPFFSNMMSLTNHYPFNHDLPIPAPYPHTKTNIDGFTSDELFNNYKNTIYYTDYALGKFWNNFKNSKLAENTIVIITADHGIWSFPKEQIEEQAVVALDEEFFRIPLLIYHPQISESREINTIASQIDILPSLMQLLNLELDESNYIGKSIFSSVKKPWAAMTKSGQVFVRQKDYLCHQSEDRCKGAHQVCLSVQHYDIPLAGQKCEKVIGDPLNGGSFEETIVEQDILSQAHQMIGLENQRVFDDITKIASIQPIHKTNRQIRMEAAREKRAKLK